MEWQHSVKAKRKTTANFSLSLSFFLMKSKYYSTFIKKKNNTRKLVQLFRAAVVMNCNTNYELKCATISLIN